MTEFTPAEARALADSIMGTRPDTTEELVEAMAAEAPEADEERGLPPSGNAEGLDELGSGCPDDGPEHNPWRAE